MLGWAAFPVIFFGLLLQGILFGFGGLSTLGVNTFTMASPSVLCGLLARRSVTGPNLAKASFAGFLCGALPVFISACLVGLALWLSGEKGTYAALSWLIIVGNFPVIVIEGFVCMFSVQFFRKVRPELLIHAPLRTASPSESPGEITSESPS
jgi:cobalt/nickel transport system permease protein